MDAAERNREYQRRYRERHPAKVRAYKRIWTQKAQAGQPTKGLADTVKDTDFICASCKIREVVDPYAFERSEDDGLPALPPSLEIDAHTLKDLRRFALVFVEMSGDDVWDAIDFVNWLEPDVVGSERHEFLANLRRSMTRNGPEAA